MKQLYKFFAVSNRLRKRVKQTSEDGLKSIGLWEGKIVNKKGLHVVYDDHTGKPIKSWVKGATIGYGHLITSKEEFVLFKKGITEEEALELLDDDSAIAEKTINKLVEPKLKQNQYDALVSLVYNIGGTNFRKSSLLKLFNGEDGSNYDTLEDAWKAYKKTNGKVSKGLINRREKEWKLFSEGDYQLS